MFRVIRPCRQVCDTEKCKVSLKCHMRLVQTEGRREGEWENGRRVMGGEVGGGCYMSTFMLLVQQSWHTDVVD